MRGPVDQGAEAGVRFYFRCRVRLIFLSAVVRAPTARSHGTRQARGKWDEEGRKEGGLELGSRGLYLFAYGSLLARYAVAIAHVGGARTLYLECIGYEFKKETVGS